MSYSFNARRFAMVAASFAMITATGLPTAGVAGQFALAPQMVGPAMNCSIPNHVVCTISSAKGLKLVKITANTPQGSVNLVNKSYNGCPKQVQVSWDSAYQMAGKQIVECNGGGFRLKAR
ncbi:hypothetical protein JYP49_19770 [Nitratireductor aquimarinus]|uniref:hypothetical protein n=1 Tax=Nitratireductor TaxID=245876 RepID=UPI0019D3AC6A|nr:MULTISPECIES: hypothetical protein [Nitratireductor]MBN7778514.1 hypothetical protein [Nitratireductor pacificus]MBN7782836.1 hypothetical protein [Nitratireductor pacificus]MBN7791643.1 hypothetical protein [Nitratireductor aquimarinus]MBY6100900.1 hypothetical protein [Nitratireductor aquimarinus]MCA1262089.1 hypothetical protein [Nitratireductor aquimarinus]